jgi:hypothetical protein
VPASFSQVAGVPAMGVQSVGVDQHAIEVQLVEQRG